MNQGDYAYGNVEFRGGIFPAFNGGSVNFDLGVTPPIGGALDVGPNQGGGSTSARYRIHSDLTFDGVIFTGPADLANWGTTFVFIETSTIYLNTDLVVNNSTQGHSMALTFQTAGATCAMDGRGNRLVIGNGGVLAVSAGNFNPFTFKDLKILTGASGIITHRIGSFAAPSQPQITIWNCELVAGKGQVTSLYNADYKFRGTKNVFGYSGTILFPNNGTFGVAFSNRVTLDTQSRITVSPGTTVVFGEGNNYAPPILVFTDASSELYLDNCTVDFNPQPTAQTLFLTKGTIYINGNVNFVSGNGQGTYQLGDGSNPANNCNLIILPGSKLVIGDGVQLINANV